MLSIVETMRGRSAQIQSNDGDSRFGCGIATAERLEAQSGLARVTMHFGSCGSASHALTEIVLVNQRAASRPIADRGRWLPFGPP